MATAISLRLRGAPLATPRPDACNSGQFVLAPGLARLSPARWRARRRPSLAERLGCDGGLSLRLGSHRRRARVGRPRRCLRPRRGHRRRRPADRPVGPHRGVAVVALLRHFGCFCCWELASVLKDSMEAFDSAGAKLIAIGVGTPDKARILADRLPFPVDSLYADPERKAYNVLGLYHGLGRTLFSPASAKIYSRLDYIKKATKNYTLEGTPSDLTGVLQQGGMFVFRGKELLYSWRDEGTGDHAPLDDVLSACRNVPVA